MYVYDKPFLKDHILITHCQVSLYLLLNSHIYTAGQYVNTCTIIDGKWLYFITCGHVVCG